MDGAHVPFNIGAVLRDLALDARSLRSVRGDRGARRRQGRCRVSWPNSPGAPRPLSSPICRDQAGAARRSSCRRSRSSLGLVSEVEPDAKRALKRGLELASPSQRLAPRHRLALSRRGAAEARSARRPRCRTERAARRACPRPRRARLMAPDSSLMTKARSALSTVFGFSDFRPGQEDVLAATFAGEDVLAVMPTGSGKSLLLPASRDRPRRPHAWWFRR